MCLSIQHDQFIAINIPFSHSEKPIVYITSYKFSIQPKNGACTAATATATPVSRFLHLTIHYTHSTLQYSTVYIHSTLQYSTVTTVQQVVRGDAETQ